MFWQKFTWTRYTKCTLHLWEVSFFCRHWLHWQQQKHRQPEQLYAYGRPLPSLVLTISSPIATCMYVTKLHFSTQHIHVLHMILILNSINQLVHVKEVIVFSVKKDLNFYTHFKLMLCFKGLITWEVVAVVNVATVTWQSAHDGLHQYSHIIATFLN